jgi:hypothetical protein
MSNTELPALGKAAPRALHMREPRHTRSVPTKFFTIAEVADRLAVHPRTICRKISSPASSYRSFRIFSTTDGARCASH